MHLAQRSELPILPNQAPFQEASRRQGGSRNSIIFQPSCSDEDAKSANGFQGNVLCPRPREADFEAIDRSASWKQDTEEPLLSLVCHGVVMQDVVEDRELLYKMFLTCEQRTGPTEPLRSCCTCKHHRICTSYHFDKIADHGRDRRSKGR
jgi:hypothetical protein